MNEVLDGEVLTLRSGHCTADFLRKMSQFRQSGLYIDIRLEVDGDQDWNGGDLVAHKLVLACCSPYFEAMFSKNFEKPSETSNSTNCQTVKIGGPGLTFVGLQKVIDFIYTGLLKVDLSNAVQILAAADILLLQETRRVLLQSYLPKVIDISNCLICKRISEIYNCNVLSVATHNYITRNFEDIFKESRENFCKEINSEEMKAFLKESSLHVSSEDYLLEILHVWTSYGTPEESKLRHTQLTDLLQLIWWKHISQDAKLSYAEKLGLHQVEINCNSSPSELCHRRGKISFLLAISHDSKVVEYLDMTNIDGGFKILTELPLRYGLNGAAIASHNESLIVTGGVMHGSILSAVKRVLIYNFRTNRWVQGPDLTTPRKRHSCTVHKGCLYALGGTDSENFSNTMEVLDLEKHFPTRSFKTGTKSSNNDFFEPGRWQFVCEAGILGFVSFTLVSASERLFAIATYFQRMDEQARSWFADCFFDESTREWKRLEVSNSRTQRDRPGVIGHEGFIFVAGGILTDDQSGVRRRTKIVEKFDIANNVWNRLPDMRVARESPGVFYAGDKLFVIGGRLDDVGEGGTIETFNFELNAWEDLKARVRHADDEYNARLIQ